MRVVTHCVKVASSSYSSKVSGKHFTKASNQFTISISIVGSGTCPECNVLLRRVNFRYQMFEDPQVEKEIDIRRRILRDYNKKVRALSRNLFSRWNLSVRFSLQEEDFATPEEYDDYLEEIENIIYNLCHDIDVTNTNKRIDQYKRENREIILKNKSRVGRDEQELMLVLEQEKIENEQRRIEREAIERDAMKKKLKEKEALIDELMFSYEDASKIVDGYAKQAEKTREEAKILPAVKSQVEFSTGVKFGQPAQFLPVPKLEEGPLYVYESPTIITDGPPPPILAEIEANGYTQHIRWALFVFFVENAIL